MVDLSESLKQELATLRDRLARVERGELWGARSFEPYTPAEKAEEIALTKARIAEIEASLQGVPPVGARQALVAVSVRTNRTAIVLSVASLMVLIDDKLATLRDERPNARDAQAVRHEAIAHYENLKQDLEALRDVAFQLERGKAKAKTVESVANTFVQGIQNWWEKGHEKICNKALDAAIFISCLSVCSLVGCGGATAVVVSGAIAGGKPVVDALKALSKRLR
jgi:hypothetical protein